MQTDYPKDLRYTEEHEWVGPVGGGLYAVGITAHAAEQLGDVTYVELPKVDREVSKGEAAAAVESVKAASDVYAPVSGRVAEVNDLLEGAPETVNRDAHGDGWFFKLADVKAAEFEALMTAEQYEAFLQEHEA
jgi:glycine cleavage system H protein